MRQTLRYIFRSLVVLAFVVSLPALVSPTAPPGGPYPSALSLSGFVLAAPSRCNNTGCGSGPRLSFKCNVSQIGTNCKIANHDCSISAC
jgi:hypothetical protein